MATTTTGACAMLRPALSTACHSPSRRASVTLPAPKWRFQLRPAGGQHGGARGRRPRPSRLREQPGAVGCLRHA
ncbi:hypothetical protein LP419_15295 [Massilia sp. H-1]|nr:hypothetical protein LP419_15295 [Massilia sp. H-1]